MRQPPLILAVDDTPENLEILTVRLKAHGYEIATAPDGEQGLARARELEPDLILLDIMMPKLDGIAVVRELKRDPRLRAVPVILVTAKADTRDVVQGLDAGGDDYLTKPFAFAELLARVQALIRRSTGAAEPTTLTAGNLTLDLLTREVRRDGHPIELRPREYALLEYLLRHAGKVLTKTMILSHVWGYNFDPNTNVVDVLVSRLREKIDRSFDPKLIHTVRGVGYVLKVG
jgi:two-component system, OmpR family, response regulator